MFIHSPVKLRAQEEVMMQNPVSLMKIKLTKKKPTIATILCCMPKTSCRSWSPHVATSLFSSLFSYFSFSNFSNPPQMGTNQFLCWSVSKCLCCNLMKANSHKGGKLLPGNSTPQAVLFIFPFSPVGSHFLWHHHKMRAVYAGSYSHA